MAFRRNRLRLTPSLAGALGFGGSSLARRSGVSKGLGTGDSNEGLARSIRGADRAACARLVARHLVQARALGSGPSVWRRCGLPEVRNGEYGRSVWATHAAGSVG